MAEGLSAVEVGREIGEHAGRRHDDRGEHKDLKIAVVEAVLLAVVAVLAAWSGFASAKWSTASRLDLAKASTARTLAGNAALASMSQRNFDSSTFTVWFVAYVAGDAQKEAVAERRFTPNFHRAFDAWIATNPFTNPNAPPGPTYMPQYRQPQAALASSLNNKADRLYSQGSSDGSHSDDYVRVTIFLATVLFLIAISGHFVVRGLRIGLIVVGATVLTLAVIDLVTLPFPP